MKTPNLIIGTVASMVGTIWLILSVTAANNPFGNTPCLLPMEACNTTARELGRQDFVNGFLVYSVFTTVSILVLFLGRTKLNKSSVASSKNIEKGT
jgi:hypothetical protein